MSTPAATNDVGFYSIGVRGLAVPELLAWAHREGIGFVHLRGGPRGFALADQSRATLHRWYQAARATVPITGVTVDTDLAELLAPDPAVQTRAREHIARLSDAAAILGASWVRLLARTPPDLHRWVDPTDALPTVPLLVELHHPGWLTSEAVRWLTATVEACPLLRVLADTVQLAGDTDAMPPDVRGADPVLARIVDASAVLHLSDDGRGLDRPGHGRVARLAARRIAAGQPIAVAVEWTGADRSPPVALDRYRAAAAWWRAVLGGAPGGPA